jgi:hypothetical protein
VDDGGAEDQPYGWGSAQPPHMRATVHYGGSDEPLTTERRALLGSQLEQARAAALAIGTVAEAERQGFVRNFQRIDGRGWDYINWSRFRDELDLSSPSMVVLADDEPDSRVVSVAYNITRSVDEGPPTDMPLESIGWHYHASLCQGLDTMVGSIEYDAEGVPNQDQIERCYELGTQLRNDLSNWMVDLWVIPGWENPWGLISSRHPDLMPAGTPYYSVPGVDDDGLQLMCEIQDGPSA